METHTAFDLVETRPVPDYRGEGRLFRHRGSGAQVFHLANDDRENMFSFSFPTYPSDSTGVAHILEHTVLSGSESFPVKDPFLQLLKGSVNTFLNAMTYPDKTVYPAASPVRQDLFNMMRVYGDAVFFPLLKPELFRQEGHRLQFDEDGRLIRTGIVYNEMKGNYSSHDSVVGETCFQTLFPDTIYGHDSGGDPRAIPELTYEAFTAFHRQYYHPANARIFLYGDIPSAEYLAFLDEHFLSRFSRQEPVATPTPATRWEAPRRAEATYPLDGVEDLSGRTSVTVNWRLFPVTDARAVVDAAVLSEILLGHSGSPLARALLESGLGQDLSPVLGLETAMQDAVFSAGLRGTDPDREEAIVELVMDTLTRLAQEGIAPDTVEGALRRVEFSNREIKSGPNGMRAMRRALRGWMYGGDPWSGLHFEAHVEALRKDLETNPRFFEDLLSRELLDNPHRATVVVRPDPDQSARESAELERELAEIDASLDQAGRERIGRETAELERMQETPDDPAALARIPFLRLEDIPREIQTVPFERQELAGAGSLFRHRQFTNGILYLDVAFDFDRLTERQELLLNLLGAAFTEVGLPGQPHWALNDEINLKTGGITAYISNQTRMGDRSRVRRLLILRMRVLERSWREGAELFRRIVAELDFSDHQRLHQLIDEMVQEMQSAVIPSGHYFSGLRAGAELHDLIALEEGMNGITQLDALRAFAADPAAVAAELNELFSFLVDPARAQVNITGRDETITAVEQWLPALLEVCGRRREAVRAGGETATDRSPADDGVGVAIATRRDWTHREFLMASATVSYVALAMPGIAFGDRLAEAQDLLAHILRTGPLWEKIRMQGGAYGAFASSRTAEALFSFGSYRDPHTLRTLDAYASALAELAEHPLDASQLDLAKVSVLGRELRPLTPRDAAFTNFRRRLHDIDNTLRQEARDRLRAVSATDLQDAASVLGTRVATGRVVILGGSTGLEEWKSRAGDVPVVQTGV